MKVYSYLLILFFVVSGVKGISQENSRVEKEDALVIWSDANNRYIEGDYQSSLELYYSLVESDYISASLFYNIANCYYKQGNISKAILYYERSLKLDPSNRDVINNLSIVKLRTTDTIDELPEFFIKTWVRNFNYKFNSNTWSYISLIFLTLSLTLFVLFRFSIKSGVRKFYFFSSVILLCITFLFLGFAVNQKINYNRQDAAIIMQPVVTLRSTPSNSGTTLFILHEGTKINIIENLGEWSRVEIADGRQGWIKKSDIEII